MRRSLTWRSGT
jgi:hypothetical protein